MTITATEGKVFRRIHDGFVMGSEVVLGTDYSTGTAREDLAEYYEEIDDERELSDQEIFDILIGKHE